MVVDDIIVLFCGGNDGREEIREWWKVVPWLVMLVGRRVVVGGPHGW